MVTRVYDRAGHIVHDCRELGCAVSWDGYTIATGDPVPGRTEPPSRFTVTGDEARED